MVSETAPSPPVIWVGYTTEYRHGGAKFARVARTLADDNAAAHPRHEVLCRPVERKAAFADAMATLAAQGKEIEALHFVGHGGMYGPMFGTVRWPEQFSPHEWRHLTIPFSSSGRAVFHTCRSARWFAAFFARTFDVPTYGYYWYTTFSRQPDRFAWDALQPRSPKLYVFGCPGRRSHGFGASARKYLNLTAPESLQRFDPPKDIPNTGYDDVAQLYDAAFSDISVRHAEWRWIRQQVDASATPPRVLDIGCGNGSLLARLAPHIAKGVGVDLSEKMVAAAARRYGKEEKLAFHQVDGPAFPFPDNSFDLAISFLSFRYLDWDPTLKELQRVMTPRGRLLVVDLAAKALGAFDVPRFAVDQLRQLGVHLRHPQFRPALRKLVG